MVFCRFNVKDGGFFFFTCGLPLPFTCGVEVGPLLAGTVGADLAASKDPVFLARGLR